MPKVLVLYAVRAEPPKRPAIYRKHGASAAEISD